ncbi:chromate efflux transporter [Tistrella bauzanensis]|uniref:chromate efflux transporter n=1 Tax=Tistrella TaxID=171436 RepID=UPI0031F6AA35
MGQNHDAASAPAVARGSMAEVFGAFLKLGCTAFGGPVAHLGFFRTEFVDRRGWLDDAGYARLVALCQFLPGPASSQVGVALGLGRAGLGGALAAWAGFTLPSALLMIMAGLAVAGGQGGGWLPDGLTGGLKIAALAVVVQAVAGMARSLAPDARRMTLAVTAAALALMVPGLAGQLGGILLGLIVAAVVPLDADASAPAATPATPAATRATTRPVPRRAALVAAVLFVAGLVLLPLAAASGGPLAGLADGMYRAGSMVFGGGHVVLPLLAAETASQVDAQAFMMGYGLAQAVPGPLFTFGAFLGAVAGGWIGGVVALVAIFLPALLLVVAVLPLWDRVSRRPWARRLLAGVNAAVLGLLMAALYHPVFTSAVAGPRDAALALVALVALLVWRLPVWALVPAAAAAGMAAAAIG